MILSSPLNKKWNTALLSFPPILLFNYTSNFGCTIIIPHQSNLVDQESFLISYSFFEIIYLLLHLNYSHCEEILQSPIFHSLFLFILKKEIKTIQIKSLKLYYVLSNLKNSRIHGKILGLCFLQSANNEDLVIVKTRFVAVLHFDEKVVIWLFFSHDIMVVMSSCFSR